MKTQLTLTVDPTDVVELRSAIEVLETLAAKNKKIVKIPKGATDPEQLSESISPQEATPVNPAEAAPTTLLYTLDQLRAQVSEKAKTHREQLKAELSKLGASSVSTLDASNYNAFGDFLKTLN